MGIQDFKIKRFEKKIKKLETQLMAKGIEHDLNMTSLNDSWAIKISLIVGIFEESINQAETIEEAREWFAEWTEDINSGMSPQEVIDKHGFEFELQQINTNYMREMKNGG